MSADVEETWVERRTSGKEVVKPPFTLNEVDQPRSLSYIEQGEWERVEERNPKLKGKGNIETMYGGFELDFKDLESFVRSHFVSLTEVLRRI